MQQSSLQVPQKAMLAARGNSGIDTDNVVWWFLAIVGLVWICRLNKWLEKQKAKRRYDKSLQRLQQAPNNPGRRVETLQLGREYARLAKDSKGRSTFNEMAIANDLSAACARATTGEDSVAKVEVTNPGALSQESAAQEIEKLGQLFLTGVITAEEFERGKTLFLGAPPDKAASAVELLQSLDALKKQGILSQSEFNMKKWEILSERLLPGKGHPAKL